MRARLTTFILSGVLAIGAGIFTLQCRGAADAGKWLGFPAYPGARELCNEHVLALSGKTQHEVHWLSFASRDATADVISFYAGREGKNAQRSSDSFEVHHGADHTLTVQPASKAVAPSCSSKPRADEKTVIVVSEQH
jgi:hypothetical protein